MGQRFPFISAVYAFVVRDGQVLLARRCNTGYRDGEYGVPAGHLDGNETAFAGMVRELREEIGAVVSEVDLRLVHVLQRKSTDERIEFFFELDGDKLSFHNAEPEKCDDLRFFPITDLPDSMIDFVRQALELSKRGIFYSAFGYERGTD